MISKAVGTLAHGPGVDDASLRKLLADAPRKAAGTGSTQSPELGGSD